MSSAKTCDYNLPVRATHSGYILAQCMDSYVWSPLFNAYLGHQDGEEKPGSVALQPRPTAPRVAVRSVHGHPEMMTTSVPLGSESAKH